jgi:peptidoglycan/LPS O-acetylase OafA/YrhL
MLPAGSDSGLATRKGEFLGAGTAAREERWPRASGADRIEGFDLLRVLACLAVVLGHVMASWRMAPEDWDQIEWIYNLRMFGLRLFSLLTGYLTAEIAARDPLRPWSKYAAQRSRRLLLPTAVWVAVTVAVYDFLRPWWRDEPNRFEWATSWIPRNHLWFPVFAGVAGILGMAALRHLPLGRASSRFSGWLWLIAAGGLFALLWYYSALPRVLANRSIAYFCLGMALRLSQGRWWHLRRHTIAQVGTLAVFVLANALQAPQHHPLSVLAIVVSLTFLASGQLPRFASWLAGPFVGTTFGIYLIHPFLVGFLQVVFVRLGFTPGPWFAVTLAIPVFVACGALVKWARRSGVPGWIIPAG